MCPNQRKSDAKQHQLFNHIFSANASTQSQTFNLSNTLKIVELKTLCMPVSATLVCLNVSRCIIRVNKLGFYIVLVCPNLSLDTALMAAFCCICTIFLNLDYIRLFPSELKRVDFGGDKEGNSTKFLFSIVAPGITTSAYDVKIIAIC